MNLLPQGKLGLLKNFINEGSKFLIILIITCNNFIIIHFLIIFKFIVITYLFWISFYKILDKIKQFTYFMLNI